MAKAIPNEALKAILLKDGFADVTNRGEDFVCSFFTGTLPEKSVLLSQLAYFTDGWVHFNTLINHIIDPAGLNMTELCRVEFNDFTYIEHLTPDTIRYNCSKRTESFTPMANGQAGWFLMFLQDEGYAYNPGEPVRWGIVGTVGEAGSGADLILTSTTFDTAVKFRMNDIVLNPQVEGTL